MTSAPQFKFVEIHSLAHRFKYASDPETKLQLAISCLEFMDHFQILHPIYVQCQLFLRAQNHASGSKYDCTWSSNIEQKGQQEIFLGDEYVGQAEKAEFFAKFIPQFQRLFIGCDFTNLQNLLNKVSLSVQFLNHCTDITLFTENGYFEFLFYQIIAVVHGLLWFPQLSTHDEQLHPNEETSPSLKWAQIERKCESYSKKCRRFLENLEENHPSVIEKVNNEFTFCTLVKWYCAFAKFQENRLTEYCTDFESLQSDIHLLESVYLKSEAILCYGIASIVAKPFKELDFCMNEQVLDFYTSSALVEASLYDVLRQLSMAQFVKVKLIWHSQLFSRLDSQISYTLPAKTKRTFWEYLTSIIDLKAFLLILSISESISRDKVLEKLGYGDATKLTRTVVSNTLVILISVLSLGEMNIFYHEAEDMFYNIPVDDRTREFELLEKIQDLDHAASAEAAAAHMKTLLIRKYFT